MDKAHQNKQLSGTVLWDAGTFIWDTRYERIESFVTHPHPRGLVQGVARLQFNLPTHESFGFLHHFARGNFLDRIP